MRQAEALWQERVVLFSQGCSSEREPSAEAVQTETNYDGWRDGSGDGWEAACEEGRGDG